MRNPANKQTNTRRWLQYPAFRGIIINLPPWKLKVQWKMKYSGWKYSGSLGNINYASNLRQNQKNQEEMSRDENTDAVLTAQSNSEWRSIIADSSCVNIASLQATPQCSSNNTYIYIFITPKMLFLKIIMMVFFIGIFSVSFSLISLKHL